MLAVELRPEERRGPLEYLVGASQFAVLLLQLTNPPRLGRRHAPDVTVINVGLLDPHSHGLDPITELRRDPLHRPVLGPQLCSQRPHHPDCSGLLLRRIPTCRRPPISLTRCHDTILDSKVRSLHRNQGGSVRSVSIDEERAPFVKLAFELYASGDHTLDDIASELTDRGLITKGNVRRAPGPVSINKVAQMLRCRYYLGKVVFKGEEYEGRHPALIDNELFNRVQSLLATRAVSGERRRVHPHYLKGTLYCGRCRLENRDIKRLILMHVTGRAGGRYSYFFCRGVQDHVCDAPYSAMAHVEEGVEDHYKTIRFTPAFVAAMRAGMESALADTETAQRLLRKNLEDQLVSLETKEENLLDFAADGTLPQSKIRVRLTDIGQQRQKLRDELATVVDDLSGGAEFLQTNLRLLENPHALYMGASDEIRRKLNQAIFKHLFVVNEEVVGDEINSPLAELLAAQHGFRAREAGLTKQDSVDQAIADLIRHSAPTTRATPKGGSSAVTVEDLLTGIDEDADCSKPSVVDPRRFELLTSSMRTRRATNCAKGPCNR